MAFSKQAQINLYYTAFAWLYDLVMRLEELPEARQFIVHSLKVPPESKVLEIGAGTGKNFPFYRDDVLYTALDINRKMLARAEKRRSGLHKTNIETNEGNATSLCFNDGTFDAALAVYALSAIPDSNKAFAELERVVKPGGTIGILDFNYIKTIYPAGLIGAINSNLKSILNSRRNSTITDSRRFFYPWINDSLDQTAYVLQVQS